MNNPEKQLYELIKSDNTILDFIQNNTLDGFWYLDLENPDNNLASHKFWSALGYHSDEIPRKPLAWQDTVHPDHLEMVLDQFRRHFENSNHPYDQEVRFLRKNHHSLWMRCKGQALRNKAGKAAQMVVTLVDITREKENEKTNDILFDSIDEGFCIIQMIFDAHKKPVDYRFLAINASFERQTGLSNAVGKRMREFAPNHEDHWFETYGKIALTGESIRFQNRAEQLNRWYDVYAFRFGEPQDFQVAILFNDITERQQAEETIHTLNRELEENLEQLEASNQELESFTYSVSHDLRAPLRAINGHAAILLEDFSEHLNDDAKRSIDAICRNSKKMGTLIDDLLTFSRLGRKDVDRNFVDTEDIVKNIVEDMCHQYTLDKSIFKLGNLPPAHGDNALLKQVWINLISNAQKYSQNSTPPVIEIGAVQNIPQEITYYVKDNGVGFDMLYYDKLFGVFQRLHAEDEFSGTGVGLAIVQRIVSKHGGKVWAEAKPNQGAQFYFTLPVSEFTSAD